MTMHDDKRAARLFFIVLLVFCWCSAGVMLAHVIRTWKLEKAAPKLEVYLSISIHEAGNLLIHKYQESWKIMHS